MPQEQRGGPCGWSRVSRVESERDEMRWEVLAGPGKEFEFYLNYNTMLHGSFFSRYIYDPIHLCNGWLAAPRAERGDPRVQPEADPVVLGKQDMAETGQAPGPPAGLTPSG